MPEIWSTEFLWCALLFVSVLSYNTCSCQLVVNVKNNGGDVYRENIEANTTQDSIVLEFRKADGTMITQFIDGRNEVQVFRVVVLPEEELGQTHIQTMCFVLRFTKNEFISSDAMSKLRQKNPSTVRHPEETRPMETFEFDLTLNVEASHVVSAHISEICKGASMFTYTRDSDLHLLSQILNRDYTILRSVVKPAPIANLTSCADFLYESSSTAPCLCHYDVCVGWYPCGLKYCRGKDSAGRIVSYRCGIKTCSRCRRFEFRVSSKNFCVWDEPEFQLTNWQADLESAVDGADAAAVADSNINNNEDNSNNGAVEEKPIAVQNELARKANSEMNHPADSDGASVPHGNVKMIQKLDAIEQSSVKSDLRVSENESVRQNVKLVSSVPPPNVPDDDEDGE